MIKKDIGWRIWIMAVCMSFAASCSDNINKSFGSYEELCEASGGKYNAESKRCRCGAENGLSGTECNAGVICINDVCGNQLCSAGDFKCENGMLYACINNGKTDVWGAYSACRFGYCEVGNKACAKCLKSDVNECGKIEAGKICIHGQNVDCTNSSCTENNKFSCLNDKVRVQCVNGEYDYINSKPCADNEKCENGECTAKSDADVHNAECTESIVICNGNIVSKCENGILKTTQCNDSEDCKDGEGCVPKDAGECVNGAILCAEESKTSYRECNSGKWGDELIPCPDDKKCAEGKCYDDECKDDEVKCNEEGTIIQKCDNGQWTDAAERCKDGQYCSTKANKCVDICSDIVCPTGEECDKGTNKCAEKKYDECADGHVEKKCENNDNIGMLTVLCNDVPIANMENTPCIYEKAEVSCKGDGACGACKNMDTQCSDNKVWKCEDGEWKILEDCSENGRICNAETYECESASELENCSEDAERCVDDGDVGRIEKCTKGKWERINNCEGDVSCEADGKKCGECQNTKTECVGVKIRECSDGKWGDEHSCEGDNKCDAEKNECPGGSGDKCIVGERRCNTDKTAVEVCDGVQWNAVKNCGNNMYCDDVDVITCKEGCVNNKNCEYGTCNSTTNACEAECNKGDVQCVNGYSYNKECVNGVWNDKKGECAICTNNKCIEKCSCSQDRKSVECGELNYSCPEFSVMNLVGSVKCYSDVCYDDVKCENGRVNFYQNGGIVKAMICNIDSIPKYCIGTSACGSCKKGDKVFSFDDDGNIDGLYVCGDEWELVGDFKFEESYAWVVECYLGYDSTYNNFTINLKKDKDVNVPEIVSCSYSSNVTSGVWCGDKFVVVNINGYSVCQVGYEKPDGSGCSGGSPVTCKKSK